MRNNGTTQDFTQMREELIHSIGLYIHIINDILKEKNLHYESVSSYHALDDQRIVFDVRTEEKYTVHVDTIQSKCTIEQFLDCVYGKGSESDHKVIIYKGNNEPFEDEYTHPDLNEFSPEEYFVSLLVEQCDIIGLPFSIIEYSQIEEGLLLGPSFRNRNEYKASNLSKGSSPRLPSKWDVQRMAFWALYFNPYWKEKYHLEDLHCTESREFKILDDLCVLAKWDEEGISYIIADNQQSEFLPWLWRYGQLYLDKYASFRPRSFYRDGRQSRICIPGDGVPIYKLNEMSERELRELGIDLYRKIDALRSDVVNMWNQYNSAERKGVDKEMHECTKQ